jgi:hypothetical protein
MSIKFFKRDFISQSLHAIFDTAFHFKCGLKAAEICTATCQFLQKFSHDTFITATVFKSYEQHNSQRISSLVTSAVT